MSNIRNIYIVAISLILAFIIQITLSKSITYIVLLVFILVCIYMFFIKKTYKKIILYSVLAVIFSALYLNVYNLYIESTIDRLSNDNTKIEGYITEINNDFSFGSRYTLKIEKIDDENTYETFVYFYSDEDFSLGKEMYIYGELSSNFSSYSTYLFSKNVFGTFNFDNIEIKNTSKIDINILGALIRNEILDNMQKLYTGDVLALSMSIGYSDKSLVNEDILEDFNITGISHMLVVSGLHVGIISLFLNLVLSKIPIKKKTKNIILSVCLLFLSVIIGFTYSIQRAVFIMIILLLLRNFKLYPDTFSSLSLIVILTVLQNPYSSIDIGLLLSYIAFIGVIIGIKFTENKNYNTVLKAVVISLFAVVFTIPVLSFSGIKLTLISPIVNPLFSFLIMPVAVLSFFTPIISFIKILSPINNILVFINTSLINIFLYSVNFIADNFYFSFIDISKGIFQVLIITIITTSLISTLLFKNKKMIAGVTALSCIISILCYNLISYNTVSVTMIDTGRFVSSIIRYDFSIDLILKEKISEEEINYILKDNKKNEFNNIILCFSEELEFDLSKYANEVYEFRENESYVFDSYEFYIENGDLFKLSSGELTVLTSLDRDVINEEGIYFLASNPPNVFNLNEIYYYQNGVLSNQYKEFINLNIGTRVYDNITINVNLINGNYNIVKDVHNYANWI